MTSNKRQVTRSKPEILKRIRSDITRSQRGIAHILVLLLLLAAIPVGIYLVMHPAIFKPKASSASIGKIIVQGTKLIDTSTGQEFIVRSNQFIKIEPNPLKLNSTNPNAVDIINTFSPNIYNPKIDDPYEEEHFSRMENMGYNTIRLVFHTYADGEYDVSGLCRNPDSSKYKFTDCVNPQSLQNLIDTINKAKAYNLKVILTFVGGIPARYSTYFNKSEPRGPVKDFLLNPEAVDDYARYLKDFLSYLKGRIDFNTFLAIQPQAEPALDGNSYPFQGGAQITPGEFNVKNTFQVTPELINKINGGHISSQMRQLIAEAFTISFNKWFDAIKSVDPTLLTAYDQFPTYAIRGEDGHLEGGQRIPFRIIDDLELLNPDLKADIIGIQTYRYLPKSGPQNPELDYDNLTSGQSIYLMYNFTEDFQPKLMAHQKPFMIWEFGYFPDTDPPQAIKDPVNFLKEWMVSTCPYKPSGWNYFFWRSANSLSTNTADDNNFLIAKGLSPQVIGDPCGRTTNPPTLSPQPSTVPSSSLMPKIYKITRAGLNTSYNPWAIWFISKNINPNLKMRIFDQGNLWQDVPIVYGDPTSGTLQIPTNLLPSKCNQNSSCDIQIMLIDPKTKTKSNRFTINLPKPND